MSKILLAIKPEYVERILNKEKLFEFRKRLPSQPVETIFIYSTYPVMKIVASVEVVDLIKGSPTTVWSQTKHAAGISRAHYREYFKGVRNAYAFVLGEINQFDIPLDLNNYGIQAAPQSFVYLKDNIDEY